MSFWQIILGVLLSMTPVFELRGGIPLMMASGVNNYLAFVLAVASNIIVIPVIFFFLDYLHHHFMKIGFYKNIFEKWLDRVRHKYHNKFDHWPYLALCLFVAIPIPTTGVYTATLIAWFFKFDREKSFFAMATGVVIAGIIVTGVYTGIASLIF